LCAVEGRRKLMPSSSFHCGRLAGKSAFGL
jgi:hypothetical protein